MEAPYDELGEQMAGLDDTLLGGTGRPQPEIVGEALWEAITTESPALRVPVGADAEFVMAARSSLDDEALRAGHAARRRSA